jgi:4-diphosphocytidyl-2-C-methyl-D-erythritol kinase
MKIRSFAKINLGIEVLGKRADNYHDIKTLFQAVDFFDVLDFSFAAGDTIRLKGNDQAIPWDESNLIFQGASLLRQKYGARGGVEINVVKNIPPGRGLGGGSSNAAMTLYALNELWSLGLDKETLQRLAAPLGADVPYFLEGGLCLGEARGDKVTALPDLPRLYCVLALPSFPVSTGAIYGHMRLTSGGKESKINQFLAQRDFGLLENRLEKAVFSLYPRLKAIKSFFHQREAILSLVTGTGSAVFGLFLQKEKAEKALSELEGVEEALLVETLSRERYWKKATAGV